MKGSIVSNTGPIIALASITKLEILNEIFDEVIVPEQVHHEIIRGGKDFVGLAFYRKASWIKVESIKTPIEPLLETLLDKGEASAIRLVSQVRADYLLIDERKARKIARKVYGLNVVGSAGILVEAKRRGLIPSVREALDGMRHAGYWIHDDIMEAALRKADEL
jgi:predicted nucleic acid-binding protein